MTQHVVVETVFGKNIGLEIAVVVKPIVCELLWAEYQHRTVAQFVIFDYRKRGEGFSQTDTVRQNATAEGFQLIDDAGGSILLEVEQLLPDQAVLIAGSIIGQVIFIQVFKELIEDVVEHQEIDAFRGVFLIHRVDVITDAGCDILQLSLIVPYLIEEVQKHPSVGRLVKFVDDIRYRVAALIAKIDSRKTMERHIDGRSIRCLNTGKLLHRGGAAIGAEGGFAPYPVCTFLGNRTLGQLVFELNLELAAVKAALTFNLWNMVLAVFLIELVGDFVRNEGRRSKYEFQGLNALKLTFQRLESVNRKA